MKNLKVFATTNNIDSLSPPLRSRFMEFHLPEYTFEQFSEIARIYSVKDLDTLIKLQMR